MNRTFFSRIALVVALFVVAACGRKVETPAAADLLIYGGPIYTGASARSTVEAVAIRDGRILATGALAEVEKDTNAATRRIDLKGAALFPGFVDAHAHLLGIGMRELTLNLEGVASVEELVDIVAAEVADSEPGAVVYGRGWIETGWPEGRFPTRDDLDAVSADNPVVLYRADGHALVANSAALAKAGVADETADPEGGRIERDDRGRATGVLVDNAMALVDGLVAAPTREQKERAYAVGAAVYAEYGWTGLHNMSVDPSDVGMIEALAEKQGDDSVRIRVYNALDPSGLDWLVMHAPQTAANGRIVTRAAKFYVDGALGSRGAALKAPYADKPDTTGLLLLERDDALAAYARALETGVQIATHAIGDRGNTLVLDWYAEALAATPPEKRKTAEPRFRIEHAQVLDPADITRFRGLGVVASMQPSHAIGDLFFAPARLGADRLAGAYAWRSLLDAGAIIAGGSDAPVERGDPLVEFYAATARASLDGFRGPDWALEQAVSRFEALQMFTAGPAYASFQESELGTIEPGKRADLTAFTKDLMTVPAAEILAAKAALTVVDGEIIYYNIPN